MADLSDILIEGETILWQGQADFSKARHRPDHLRSPAIRILRRALFIFLPVTIALALFWIGWSRDLTGFLGALIAVVAVGSAIFASLAVAAAMDRTIDPADLRDVYVVTNLRVFAANREFDNVLSISAGMGTCVALRRNGSVFDVHAGIPPDDAGMIVEFDAIPDGPTVHKLVLQTLIHATDLT